MITLSVIITTYKPHHKYLDQAISSVDFHPFNECEIIVVNDSPEAPIDSDGTIVVLNRTEEPRWGAGGARNRGVDMAKGDLILFLDGDDFLLPKALNMLVGKYQRVLKETGEEHVIFGNVIRGDTNKAYEPTPQYRGRDIKQSCLYRTNRPYLCLIPKKYHYQIGGFLEEDILPTHEDLLYEQMMYVAGIKDTKVEFFTYYYRWHDVGSRRSLGYDDQYKTIVSKVRQEILGDYYTGKKQLPFIGEKDMPCASCGDNPVRVTRSTTPSARILPEVEPHEEQFLVFNGTETKTHKGPVTNLSYRFGPGPRSRRKVVDKQPENVNTSTEIHIDDARAFYGLQLATGNPFREETRYKAEVINTPVEQPIRVKKPPKPKLEVVEPKPKPTVEVKDVSDYTISELGEIIEKVGSETLIAWYTQEQNREKPRIGAITLLENAITS